LLRHSILRETFLASKHRGQRNVRSWLHRSESQTAPFCSVRTVRCGPGFQGRFDP
jgi:hypothetical protein